MKSIYFIIACLGIGAFSITVAQAQTASNNYFIESSHVRTNLNPALRPNSSYIGVPFLSGIGVDYKTNTFNLENLTFKKNGERVTFMHSDVTNGEFMKNVSDKNYLSTNVGYDIFSMGFYKKDAFWNINLGVKVQTDVNIPKSFFRLMKEGFAQDIEQTYVIEDLNATANSYLELGVSYSRPFLDNSLMLGLRTKLLGGIANFDLNAEKVELTAGSDIWRARSNVKLQGSAPGVKPKFKEKEREGREPINQIDGFDFDDWTSFSGYGLGFDIGGVYDFGKLAGTIDGTMGNVLSNLKVSLAFTDMGFISWTKKNSTHLASTGEEVVIEPGDYTIHTDGSSSLEDVFDDVMDDLEQAINLEEGKRKGRSTSLRTTMNMGAEYSFFDNRLSAGLLYSLRFGNYYNVSELTISGNYRPKSWLATTLSYSFLHSDFNTVGFAMYLTPSKGVNFFVAGDYIIPNVSPEWIPTTTKAMNVQFGFSVPM
ncbi:hypothetical protein D0T53_10585 [Dysgonomonas sp. 216]|uniref:DUF5723 family protein n=1 Tax=Dysgonomonas sp. 216 TaxID=2302934 RepID=UPI0013D4D40A|nr:DUF5723 family protein [Dysgonomonas sp. 216]NDW19354.1 hypothetical protein [Dysgonomonas sp. 216]